MNMLTKVKITAVDSVAHSALNIARANKKPAWLRVKALRAKLKETMLGNSGIRFDLMLATDKWREYQRMEEGALKAIESRANELGLTTK